MNGVCDVDMYVVTGGYICMYACMHACMYVQIWHGITKLKYRFMNV